MTARRNLWGLCLLAVSFALFCCNYGSQAAPMLADSITEREVTKIAFGSCHHQDRPQHIWPSIAAYNPEVFVWLGDIVYNDIKVVAAIFRDNTVEGMRDNWNRHKNSSGYKELLNTNATIVGVWDDHDYGRNNAGIEYKDKKESQKLLLNFLDEPQESVRWKREGVYASYTFGPIGKRVKLILLDVRYFREHADLDQTGESEPDMIGEQQWAWLEKELIEANETASLILLGSGVQVLPDDKPIQEKLGAYPRSQRRLFGLLKGITKQVIILSGDVHYAEMLKRLPSCSDLQDNPSLKPLYEITSSGLTHCCGYQVPVFPPHGCRFLLNLLMRSQWQISDFYELLNWGSINIDWEAGWVTLQIHDENGGVVLEQKVPLEGKGEGCVSAYPPVARWKLRQMEYWFVWMRYAFVGAGLFFAFICWRFCVQRHKKDKKD